MKRILILFGLFLIACAMQAQQRNNPARMLDKAPGNAPDYVLMSDQNGELQFVLASLASRDTILSNPRLLGTDLIFDKMFAGNFQGTRTVSLATLKELTVTNGTDSFVENGQLYFNNGFKLDVANKEIDLGGTLRANLSWNGDDNQHNFTATSMRHISMTANGIVNISKSDTTGYLRIAAEDDLVNIIGNPVLINSFSQLGLSGQNTQLKGDVETVVTTGVNGKIRIISDDVAGDVAVPGTFIRAKSNMAEIEYSPYTLPDDVTNGSAGDVMTYDGNGNFVVAPPSGGSGGGLSIVETDATLTGTGTANDPLSVVPSSSSNFHYEIGPNGQPTEAFVEATSMAVSFARSQNQVTVTVPAGEDIDYLVVKGKISDFTQDDFVVRVVYAGQEWNTSPLNAKVPNPDFVRLFNRTAPNSTQYWNFQTDAPPSGQIQVTRLQNGEVELTFKNVRSSGSPDFLCILNF